MKGMAATSIPLHLRVEMIEEMVAYAKEHYLAQAWIDNDEDGFTGWHWDKHNTKLVIVCAANRYKEFVAVGPRHMSSVIFSYVGLIGGDAVRAYMGGAQKEQGFIDQYGTFHTREVAMEICVRNGQPLKDSGGSKIKLFSEHLY